MANISEKAKKESTFKRFINNIRLRLMSFDMLTVVFPRALCVVFRRFVVFALRLALILGFSHYFGTEIAPSIIKIPLEILDISVRASDVLSAVLILTVFTFASVVTTYIGGVFMGLYVFIIERHRIKKIRWYRKLWFAITFPLFDLIGKVSMVIAMFIKVEWKPIPHNVSKGIEELVKMK